MAIKEIQMSTCYARIVNKFSETNGNWDVVVSFSTKDITLHNENCGYIRMHFNEVLPATLSSFERIIVKPLRKLHQGILDNVDGLNKSLRLADSRFAMCTPGEYVCIEIFSKSNVIPATIMEEGLHDLLDIFDFLLQVNTYNEYMVFVEQNSYYDVCFQHDGFRIVAGNGGEAFFPMEWKQDITHTLDAYVAHLDDCFNQKAWVMEQVEKNPDSDRKVSELFADAEEIMYACEDISSLTKRFMEENGF